MRYKRGDVNNTVKLIDLHVHSTNSDGEQSPDEVILCAKEAGLSAIAITDHNVFTYTELLLAKGFRCFLESSFLWNIMFRHGKKQRKYM